MTVAIESEHALGSELHRELLARVVVVDSLNLDHDFTSSGVDVEDRFRARDLDESDFARFGVWGVGGWLNVNGADTKLIGTLAE